MSSCTSWLEGWFAYFLDKGHLPFSAPSCIGSSSPPSPSASGALSSSTDDRSHRRHNRAVASPQRPSLCKLDTSIYVSWSLYQQIKHPHVALSTEACDLRRLAVLDEGLVFTRVDLISSSCDFGNAHERMLHWAKFPDDPAALSLIRSASHRPLASRKDGISPCASKDLSLNLSLNSASVESTASRSRVARLPLRHCRQLQRSSPFLSWFGRQQLLPRPCRCHRPREPCHACQSTHVAFSIVGAFAICGSPRSIQPQ